MNQELSLSASQEEKDRYWMACAYRLAEQAAAEGEVPVGAVVVLNDVLIAEGWNQSIKKNDPTAHAEVVALRSAGVKIGNYRLVETTLYVTLEPCAMCAGAMVHARVKRLVYGAKDIKTGAAGSVFNIVDSAVLNHQLEVGSGVMGEQCSEQMSQFFRLKRQAQKAAHKLKQQQNK